MDSNTQICRYYRHGHPNVDFSKLLSIFGQNFILKKSDFDQNEISQRIISYGKYILKLLGSKNF